MDRELDDSFNGSIYMSICPYHSNIIFTRVWETAVVVTWMVKDLYSRLRKSYWNRSWTERTRTIHRVCVEKHTATKNQSIGVLRLDHSETIESNRHDPNGLDCNKNDNIQNARTRSIIGCLLFVGR